MNGPASNGAFEAIRRKARPTGRPPGTGDPGRLWMGVERGNAPRPRRGRLLAAPGDGKEVPIIRQDPSHRSLRTGYIRVGGQPAGAYIYQPQGADIIIVWAEKAP